MAFTKYIPYNYYTEDKNSNIWAFWRAIQNAIDSRKTQLVIDNLYIHTMSKDYGLKIWREALNLPELPTVEEERDRLRGYLSIQDGSESGVKQLVSSSLNINFDEVDLWLYKDVFPYDIDSHGEYALIIKKDPDDISANLDELIANVERIDSANERFIGLVIGLDSWNWGDVTTPLDNNAYYTGYYLPTYTGNLLQSLTVVDTEESNQAKFELTYKSEQISWILACTSNLNLTVKVWGGLASIYGTLFNVVDQNSPAFTASIGTQMLYAYVDSSGDFALGIFTSGFTAGTPSTYFDQQSPDSTDVIPLCLVEFTTGTETSITDTMITNINIVA